jgi:hypothetical protein
VLKRTPVALAAVVVFALFLTTAVRAQELTGQEVKPIVTVAFSGYGELIADLNFINNLAGNPQSGVVVEMLIKAGGEVKSLDQSKPWGAVVLAKGPEIQVVGFVPIADVDELKTILQANGAEIEEKDGKLTVTMNDRMLHLKSEGGWLFLSHQLASLDSVPKDPVAALGGLEKSYNLAVRLDVQNVPEMIRGMLLGFLQMGMQSSVAQKPGESDEQFALRTKMADQSFEEIERAAAELNAIQLGLAIDEKVPSVYLDVEVTALPDTETARRLTAPKGLTTNFGGFAVADAALSYNGVSRLEPDQVEQVCVMIDGYRTNLHGELDGQKLPADIEKTAKQLVDDAFAIITSAVNERDLDVGVLFLAGEERATWLGGIRVADGSKVEDLLKAIVEEAAKQAPQLKEAVQFNAAEHGGVRLHTLTVPMGELGVPQLGELFGDELVIVVGAADKAAYLSVGTDSLEALKKAIDDGKVAGKQFPPAALTVSVGSIARLVAKHVPDPRAQTVAEVIATKLAEGKGKDRLTIITTIPDNGQKVRIEIEEDLLKVFGMLPALVGAMPMGG